MNRSDLRCLNPDELDQVRRAEASGRPVALFVHGLWLSPASWDGWRRRFEARGYATLALDWPGDPTGVSLESVTAHHARIAGLLSTRPIVVGHSAGGLVAQQLAGLGLASCTVAISPAPSRGILRMPVSSLRASSPILRNPANRNRTVALSFPQFRAAFANAVDAQEARYLYDTYAVPGSGRLLFQTAFANLNPRSGTRVDNANPDRGPMQIISADQDRIVPWSVACGAFRRQQRNPGHTEFFEVLDRGHSLVIDSGWVDVAEVALRFIHRVHETRPHTASAVLAQSGACCPA